jgi:hypothetical protein
VIFVKVGFMAPSLVSSPEKGRVIEAGLTFRPKQRSGKPAFFIACAGRSPAFPELQIICKNQIS